MVKSFMILVMIGLLTGCGGGGTNPQTSQAKILNYTTKHTGEPSVKDYNAIGLTAVNASNIDRVNAFLTKEPVENVDTILEIKEVIGKLLSTPEIAVVGENPATSGIELEYEDSGATATDDIDGDITEKIHTSSDVNTSKVGNYTVTYTVQDSAGNEASNTRTVLVLPNTNDTKQVIEDAEDSSTNSLKVWYDNNKTNEATVNNIQDAEKDSHIIFLDGNVYTSRFSLAKQINDKKNTYIQWEMKTNEDFVIQILVDTKNGERWLTYFPKDTGKGYVIGYKDKIEITHGIGSKSTDGKWHTYTRDIASDLKRYEDNNTLIAIKDVIFGGKIKLDNLYFYSDSKDLIINKSAVISAPGVVLTFDDSYIASWEKMMPTFADKGVVATFFCHRWGSEDKGDITDTEVATLKNFETMGNEIGYHTKDHVGTRDKRYDKFKTAKEKAQAYYDEQITPGIATMRERGFTPESFSYPYFSGQPEHNKIIKQILPHIREFFSFIEMDETGGGHKSLEEIKPYLDRIKANEEIGVLVGHWIEQATENTNHSNKISVEKLNAIIDYANKIGLKFYTLEEAHNIYINQ